MLEQQHLVRYIADILRQARQTKQYTLDKLAEKSELDYSTVSLVESGKQNPKIYTIYKMLYALDIDIVESLTIKNHEMQNRRTAILSRLEKLEMETLESVSEFLDSFNISRIS